MCVFKVEGMRQQVKNLKDSRAIEMSRAGALCLELWLWESQLSAQRKVLLITCEADVETTSPLGPR